MELYLLSPNAQGLIIKSMVTAIVISVRPSIIDYLYLTYMYKFPFPIIDQF